MTRTLPILLLLLVGCAHTNTSVTTPTRQSIAAASTAASNAGQASTRASGHIAEFKADAQGFRTDAQRIRGDAKQVLRLLNTP